LNIWGDPELIKKYLKLKSKWGQHGKKTETRDNQNKADKYHATGRLD
jgi:hypothetical protein